MRRIGASLATLLVFTGCDRAPHESVTERANDDHVSKAEAKDPAAGDVFIGVFASETRENFGSGTPGEYRIEVVAISKSNYRATIYERGKLLEVKELVPCPVESDDYLNGRMPGRAEVLCPPKSYGSFHGFLSYSENGIRVAAVKRKYSENPGLIEQEGLKPGDPAMFEARRHKTQYYAHVSWFVYGFRKISP